MPRTSVQVWRGACVLPCRNRVPPEIPLLPLGFMWEGLTQVPLIGWSWNVRLPTEMKFAFSNEQLHSISAGGSGSQVIKPCVCFLPPFRNLGLLACGVASLMKAGSWVCLIQPPLCCTAISFETVCYLLTCGWWLGVNWGWTPACRLGCGNKIATWYT